MKLRLTRTLVILVCLTFAGGHVVFAQTPTPLYFTYRMSDQMNESFVVKMTEKADIDKALQDLNSQNIHYIVSGVVTLGHDGYNVNGLTGGYWSWHLDPETIDLADAAIEICDGRPSYIESTLEQWVGRGYCPWVAVVSSYTDVPPQADTRYISLITYWLTLDMDLTGDGKVNSLDFSSLL